MLSAQAQDDFHFLRGAKMHARDSELRCCHGSLVPSQSADFQLPVSDPPY
jgi:hypothetical protein